MSPNLRNIIALDFVKALERDGFILKRQKGSHRIYIRPEDGKQVVLAYHHTGEPLRIGTLKSLIEDAEWTDDDLVRLKLVRKS